MRPEGTQTLATIFILGHILWEEYEVEVTDEWLRWWRGLRDSRHSHMRELRVQAGGRPIRILYAFDPRRIAILLIGGDKTGRDRWYEQTVPEADDLYDRHLVDLEREGLI